MIAAEIGDELAAEEHVGALRRCGRATARGCRTRWWPLKPDWMWFGSVERSARSRWSGGVLTKRARRVEPGVPAAAADVAEVGLQPQLGEHPVGAVSLPASLPWPSGTCRRPRCNRTTTTTGCPGPACRSRSSRVSTLSTKNRSFSNSVVLLLRAEVVAGEVLLRGSSASLLAPRPSWPSCRLRPASSAVVLVIAAVGRLVVLVVVGVVVVVLRLARRSSSSSEPLVALRPRRRRERDRRPARSRAAASSAHRLAAKAYWRRPAATRSSGCGSRRRSCCAGCVGAARADLERVVAVAARRTRRRQPDEVAVPVAVDARQRAVHAGQVAADAARDRSAPARTTTACGTRRTAATASSSGCRPGGGS